MYAKYIKRLLDIVLSFIAIIILSPVYLILSILVLIFMGWPILFKQQRPGKDEKIFNMYKFRTMTNKKDKDGNLLPDEQRLTKFGKFLRSTSLDELPELWNILKGDMSIVGPRPLLVKYLPYYTEEEHHRHDVRPGLTGLAQVNGRNTLDWDERFKKDLEYVKNITIIIDVKIVLLTIRKVIISEDIASCPSTDLKFKSLDSERKLNEIFKLDVKLFEQYKNDLYKCILELMKNNVKESKRIFENMSKYLKDNSAIIYICIKDGKAVGFIWGYHIIKTRIHINYFIVTEKYRGQKIGSKLIKYMLEQNKENEFELLVDKENDKAIKLYMKNDFCKIANDNNSYKMLRKIKINV